MFLWIIFAVLSAAALGAVLWPFLRQSHAEARASSYEGAVFRDQLEEISSEQERGLISEAEAEAARTEISRRLLAASGEGEKRSTPDGRATGENLPVIVMICAFVCVPLASSALYLLYGSPGATDHPLAARLGDTPDVQKIGALVARVEARLQAHPEDGQGWEVIAPVYMRQRRFNEAADAYAKALRLLGETPKRLVDYGNALVMARDGVVEERARKALQRALSQDSSFVRAHYWLAVAKEQDGQFAGAVSAWSELLKRGKASDPWHAHVEQRLAAARQLAGDSSDSNLAGTAVQTPGVTALKGPSQEEVAAAGDMSAAERTAMISQMISGLAERLKGQGGSVAEWKRLVRSYSVLGKKEEALGALSDARGAFSNDPEALDELNELADSLGL